MKYQSKIEPTEIGAFAVALMTNVVVFTVMFQRDILQTRFRIDTVINSLAIGGFLLMQTKLKFEKNWVAGVAVAFNATYIIALVTHATSTRSIAQLLILIMINLLLFGINTADTVTKWLIKQSEMFIVVTLLIFFYYNRPAVSASPFVSEKLFEPFGSAAVLAFHLMFNIILYLLHRRQWILKGCLIAVSVYVIFQTGIRSLMFVSVMMVVVYIFIYLKQYSAKRILVALAISSLVMFVTDTNPIEIAEDFNEKNVKKYAVENTDRVEIARNYIDYMVNIKPEILILGTDREKPFTHGNLTDPSMKYGYGPHNGYISWVYTFGLPSAILFFVLLGWRYHCQKSKYIRTMFWLFIALSFVTESFYTNSGIPSLQFYALFGCSAYALSRYFTPDQDAIGRANVQKQGKCSGPQDSVGIESAA